MAKINQNKFIEHINKKWKRSTCPFCDENDWDLNSQIVTAVSVDEHNNFKLYGKFQPLVTLTCKNCGYTVFINSIVANCEDNVNEDIEE